MTAALPTAADAVRALDPAALLRHIGGQRWFGAKGGAPTAARVAHVLPLPWEEGRHAILRVEVDTATGTQRFQLPVTARAQAPEGIEPIQSAGGVALYDATADESFRHELVGAFARGCTVAYEGGQWIVEPATRTRLVLPPGEEISVGRAEQSNTSLRVGRSAILKVFRKLEAGVHPDLEITRFLTIEREFPNTPALLGSMRWEEASGPTVGGMMQELVPDAKDAWEHVLEVGRAYFAASRAEDPVDAFATDAAQLGRVTRAMHEALASGDSDPDFAPEPVGRDDVERWGERAGEQVDGAIRLLERQLTGGSLPPDRVEEARVVVRRGPHYHALIGELVELAAADAGMRIRHHGDYHLGQVLRTASGEYMVIDYEGEPARPLGERRRKQSALRDVAGMLRSFSYAAATLAGEARSAQQGMPDPATVEIRSGRWERDARGSFLGGYFGDAPASFLPRDRSHADALLTLFEIEKVFYELSYELNNRPHWLGIPLRGVARLTTAPVARGR